VGNRAQALGGTLLAAAVNHASDRLDLLQRRELIKSERDSEDTRQIHYQPTAVGRALLPVLIEMAYWGAKDDPKTAPPKSFARAYEKDRAGLLAAIKAGSDPSNN